MFLPTLNPRKKLQGEQQQSIGMNYLNIQDPRNKDIKHKESNSDHGAMDELRFFTQETTLHGVRFLFAGSFFRRLFWTLAVVACLGYCSYQVSICVFAFNERPFNTKITTHINADGSELPFPSVTLCNLNSFNARRYRQFFSTTSNRETIEKKLEDISLLTKRSKEILNEAFKKRNPELFARQKTNKHTQKYQGLFSHQLQEMILPRSTQFESCSINGMRCDGSNFTSFRSPMFGKCFTFNSAEGNKSLLYATLAGQNSGLKIRLNIERAGYLPNTINPFVGLAILIHDQKTFPIVEEFGIKIQPGVSTLCAIKRRKIINLEHPFATNCTRRSLDVFNSHSYTAYTKAACLLKCRNDYTIKTCGCTPPEFKADASVPICAPNDTVLCVYRSYEKFGASSKKNECEKDCPEPCEQVEYKTSFSYSGLQREALIEQLMSLLNGTEELSADQAIYKPLLDMTRAEREKYIDDNIVSLDIYFEDLSYDIIEQTPLYEIWALIGNLGGTFGVFLGMSLLTLLEFLDFILRRISHLFHRKRKTKAVNLVN
ncbi:hypothetical protein ACROYT_G004363 [Oculina patagonica]